MSFHQPHRGGGYIAEIYEIAPITQSGGYVVVSGCVLYRRLRRESKEHNKLLTFKPSESTTIFLSDVPIAPRSSTLSTSSVQYKQSIVVSRSSIVPGSSSSTSYHMIATKPEVQHRECCQTHVKVNDCKFNWTIYNFSFFKEKPGEPLESTIFSPTNDPGLQWRIVLYPSGNHHEYKDYLSLFLHLVSCDKPSVVVDFRFCVVDKHGRDINEHKPSRKWVFYQNRMSGHPKFLRRDYVLNPANNLLVADRLRLKCFIRSADGTFEHTNYDCNVPQVPDLSKQLAEDYGKLLESERCSDVVLVARDGAKLQAHKVVLAARSPVFAAMFEHKMRESRERGAAPRLGRGADQAAARVHLHGSGALLQGQDGAAADGRGAVRPGGPEDRLRVRAVRQHERRGRGGAAADGRHAQRPESEADGAELRQDQYPRDHRHAELSTINRCQAVSHGRYTQGARLAGGSRRAYHPLLLRGELHRRDWIYAFPCGVRTRPRGRRREISSPRRESQLLLAKNRPEAAALDHSERSRGAGPRAAETRRRAVRGQRRWIDGPAPDRHPRVSWQIRPDFCIHWSQPCATMCCRVCPLRRFPPAVAFRRRS
ncbi:unnamed protein product [Trichogramma brassicae]|uniref:BTB domain-containing protein n=1 Tax=Trichogramma brassicae TaxID=86971 RepID=A0A6H5IL16_9HYME|nr:unnamed protein product [Trichogramma brassicae]